MGIETLATGRIIRVEKDKSARRESIVRLFGVYILCALLFAVSLFLFLLTRVAVVTINYEMIDLSEKRDILLKENRELKIQYETVITPKNLERMGGELGLNYPGQSQLMPVREDGEDTKK
ncbi:MAG: hypothetical protein JW984_11435 [Deltaproteobacteria bacterium]|uniref:Cell division protein FtsL n=1 Tax=Candidatus Zymogenus saltonus TaxID=2844893 RepID=A0A9D8PPX8_9DELT|nr:hypothetical protein [Candidatus Zymogenus saltonus]